MTIILLGSSFSYVQGEGNRQVILILINQLSFTDQTIYMHISGFEALENEAAKGAINVNSGGSRTDANSYFSISSGSRGNGIHDMGESFLINEIVEHQLRADEIYLQQTGKQISNPYSIMFLPIEELKKKEQKFPIEIAALGETIKQYGYKSRVFGNNDTQKKRRLAPLLIMDQWGVSQGDVGNNTWIKDTTRPYGMKTSYTYLLEMWQEAQSEDISLTVFDLGDLYRLEQIKERMDEAYYWDVKKQIFIEMGSFIQQILNNLQENQTVIVASPMVNSQSAMEKYLLAPIWIYHLHQEGNLLISGTTKREGIIANIDIAPTILEHLEIKEKPMKMIGQEIRVINSSIDLMKELQHISVIYQQRSNVLYVYVMWQIAILIIGMIAWLKKIERLKKWIKPGLLGIMYLPLLLLYTAFWITSSDYFYIVMMIGLSLILGWITKMLPPVTGFLWISFIIFLSITLDVFMGNPLMGRCFLGYDPIIGARYYGIGNEYMGVYIGTALLLSGAILQSWKNRITLGLVAILYLFIIFLLLLPTLGTNAGGAITALIGTIFSFFSLSGFTWNRRRVLWMVILLLLGMSMLILMNAFISVEHQSHIGRAIRQVVDGNEAIIYQTILRKLATNWKLIQVSSWSKVMITSIFVLGVMFIKPKKSFYSLKETYPALFQVFYGIIVSSLVALVANDSGVVATATMIIYVAAPILYLSIHKNEHKNETNI